jgi:hypothetical protein
MGYAATGNNAKNTGDLEALRVKNSLYPLTNAHYRAMKMAFWREGWQVRHERDHLQCDLTLHDILLEACEYVVNRQLAIECQEQLIKERVMKVCYSASTDRRAFPLEGL